MINPRLIEEYGEGCNKLFNRMLEVLGPKLLGKCYALTTDGVICSGDLVGPYWLGIVSDDDNIIDKIQCKCVSISLELNNKDDDTEPIVTPIECTLERAYSEGIKVWV